MGNLGFGEIFIVLGAVIAALVVIALIPYWRIFGKAGFAPALSLLMIVPLVNIIMLYFLAFAEWPSLRQTQK